MKIINKTSNQVIDVPNEHAQMLFGQGWKEFINDERKVIREEAKEVHIEEVHRKEEVLIDEVVVKELVNRLIPIKEKQRGRPKKVGN